MLWAPWAMRSRQRSRICPAVSGVPNRLWLMASFWQNTHRRGQPLKKIAPLPRVPERGGSSQKWRAARAATGVAGIPQKP